MGPFLLRTFPLVMSDAGLLTDFLKILLNMIKFNPAYLDPEVVCGLISFLSHVCVTRADGEAAKQSLQVWILTSFKSLPFTSFVYFFL